MKYSDPSKRKPGAVRDAIIDALAYRVHGATVADITREVSARIGPTPASSIRSYLRLNTPKLFVKLDRGHYRVREEAQATLPLGDQQNGNRSSLVDMPREAFRFGKATLIHGDCFQWLATAPTNSVEAVVTDHLMASWNTANSSRINFGKAEAECGASRLRSTETNGLHCRGLQCFLAMTSLSLSDFSLRGRDCYSRSRFLARTSS